MPERQLVHQSERRTTQDRNLAAGLQPAASAQFVGLLAARRVCTDTSGDERIRKTSTWLLEQGTQTRLLRNSNKLSYVAVRWFADRKILWFLQFKFEFRNSLKRRPLLQTSSPLKHELRTHIGIGTANG